MSLQLVISKFNNRINEYRHVDAVYLVLRSDQKFCNLKRKRESSSFILLKLQNSYHDYLYKVPSFRTISKKNSSSGIFLTD